MSVRSDSRIVRAKAATSVAAFFYGYAKDLILPPPGIVST
jgi:hypothetical protein